MSEQRPDVNIIVVPGDVLLGVHDNPAVFVTKGVYATTIKNRLQEIKDDPDRADVLKPELIVTNKTILINEKSMNISDLAKKAQIIWHEFGHAVKGPAEPGAYVFEVQQLIRAVDDGVFTLRVLILFYSTKVAYEIKHKGGVTLRKYVLPLNQSN